MTDLREKLKAIRDSDHPARHWARNVVQILDDMKASPDDPDLLRALGRCVAMFELEMRGERLLRSHWLTPDEISTIFGLGPHRNDPQ